MKAIEVRETELGLYVTYIYKAEQLEEEQYIGFVLSDTEGNKFNYMPYYINGGEEILDNGYHKVTYAYQKQGDILAFFQDEQLMYSIETNLGEKELEQIIGEMK